MADPHYAWDHATYCGLFVEQAARIAEIAADTDLDTPVPSCPGWTLAKLVKHVAIAHAWAAANAVAASPAAPVDPRSVDIGLPADRAEYPAWLVAGAERAAKTLWEAGADAEAWTFGGAPHVRFWSRRMFHETLMHRVDAELAAGVEPEITPAAAVDCIDELFAVMPGAGPRPVDQRPHGNGETLHFHTSGGVAGEWTVTLTPDGYTWERGHAKGDVALRGDSRAVLEVLYRRGGLDGALADAKVEVFGDRALLDRWLALSAL
ncbi:maleylpyruvate isomerase family mycothiol-dependent enzyme [Yinghuangia seranimata]|uniref:maleylpyruvate isomerase family mycothiol-dependent enzyme n=1 Tax=Yinghuangia seranimata TaxID=408067 RepID=UPI00248C6E8A|nr:maleylpyruvate isomerase family mycothiol-dependent enzyme [Yinghuangia seranimata]MDI2128541.1 maleylpyruvate isomerase family mycothiol-dependent enzyme [Yinghuangia seranimata]